MGWAVGGCTAPHPDTAHLLLRFRRAATAATCYFVLRQVARGRKLRYLLLCEHSQCGTAALASGLCRIQTTAFGEADLPQVAQRM